MSRRGCSWMLYRPAQLATLDRPAQDEQLIANGMADLSWREGTAFDTRALARDLVKQWAGPELVGARIRISSRGEVHTYEVISPRPGHLNVRAL